MRCRWLTNYRINGVDCLAVYSANLPDNVLVIWLVTVHGRMYVCVINDIDQHCWEWPTEARTLSHCYLKCIPWFVLGWMNFRPHVEHFPCSDLLFSKSDSRGHVVSTGLVSPGINWSNLQLNLYSAANIPNTSKQIHNKHSQYHSCIGSSISI